MPEILAAPRRRLRRALVAQFQRPHGPLGHLAGLVMTLRGSNRARNAWTVALLDPRPGERVLELGCGPGLALAAAARRVGPGLVVGVDHSPAMLRHARLRNLADVARGRVRLVPGEVDALPPLPGPFDALLAVNAILWSEDPDALVRRLAALMRPGGRMAITFQSRRARATDADSRAGGEALAGRLRAAGLVDVRMESLPLRPVCAVCVLGRRAPGATDQPSIRQPV